MVLTNKPVMIPILWHSVSEHNTRSASVLHSSMSRVVASKSDSGSSRSGVYQVGLPHLLAHEHQPGLEVSWRERSFCAWVPAGQHTVFSGIFIVTTLYCVYTWLIITLLQFHGRPGPTCTDPCTDTWLLPQNLEPRHQPAQLLGRSRLADICLLGRPGYGARIGRFENSSYRGTLPQYLLN